jgi:hypothetical protein
MLNVIVMQEVEYYFLDAFWTEAKKRYLLSV